MESAQAQQAIPSPAERHIEKKEEEKRREEEKRTRLRRRERRRGRGKASQETAETCWFSSEDGLLPFFTTKDFSLQSGPLQLRKKKVLAIPVLSKLPGQQPGSH